MRHLVSWTVLLLTLCAAPPAPAADDVPPPAVRWSRSSGVLTVRVAPAEGLTPADLEGPSTLTFARPAGMVEGDTGITRSKGCTPEYASPEQCAHVMYHKDIVPLDGRSDLYSLGVIGFEMLAGQLPFKSKTRLDVMKMHLEDVPPSVGSMGVRVPKKLARFIDRCLAKDRDERWANTNEAYQYLHEVVYPPVWKTVAKVTVPIVLAGIAIGAWIWSTRDVVTPTASLVTANGIDLEGESLEDLRSGQIARFCSEPTPGLGVRRVGDLNWLRLAIQFEGIEIAIAFVFRDIVIGHAI